MPNRVSLQDMNIMTDPQSTFDWALWLPSVPGGPYTSRDFTFRCTTTEKPQAEQESFKVEAQGLQFQWPGRRVWSMTLPVTLFETRDGIAADLVDRWLDFCRNVQTNTGNYGAAFAVSAELDLYDSPGNITQKVGLTRFYPLTRGAGTLDNASGLLTYACNFSYDRTIALPINA